MSIVWVKWDMPELYVMCMIIKEYNINTNNAIN